MNILAIDIGTSACKATLVDSSLQILGSASVAYPTRFPHPSWVEQDPNDWWRAVVKAVHQLFDNSNCHKEQVSAIGVSGHMLGLVPVDANGAALRPAMIHADTRSTIEKQRLEELVGTQWLYEHSGNVLSESAPLCKAMWLAANEPERYHRTARFLQSKDFITARLTGRIDSTDYSDATHALLVDCRSKQYLESVFSAVGLDPSKFPQLYRGTDVAGKLQQAPARELGLPAGIPIAVGGGDGACASAGAGVAKPGDIYCSLGTTAWIAYEQAVPIVDNPPRVFNIQTLDGDHHGVFGTTQAGGRIVTWVQELFGIPSPQQLDEIAAEVPPGSNGLVFLPYLEGERSPIFDAKARGNFFGITPVHSRSHFLRAALEGTAFALCDILCVLRESGEIPAMRIIGGGAKSKFWKQIIADVCEIAVEDISTASDSATSLGAAIAAGVAVGIFPDTATAASRITVTSRILPRGETAEVYRKNFATYRSVYQQLKPVYQRL